MSETIYIKFKDNVKECVTLMFDGPLEGENKYGGVQYIYGVKELITGETKFSATEKLNEKIQALGVGEGDSIYITKVRKEDVNNGNPFFTVEMSANQPVKETVPQKMHKSVENFEEQFKPKEEKLELHELAMRVGVLEQEVNELKRNAVPV